MLKLFGKKEEEVSIGKGFIPIDRVKELSDKGFSEPEIIDVLRKEGFGAEEIDRALTQVLKIGVTGQPEEPELPTMDELQPEQPEQYPGAPQIPEQSMSYPQQGYGAEELVESVVNEKMDAVQQKFAEMNTKQASLERSIANLHHQLSVMSQGRSQTEQSMIAKLDSLKDTMDEMSGRLSSLEKAFKDALPALIESVRSLTDLVQRVKREG
jgi:flagellar capping protein FliD